MEALVTQKRDEFHAGLVADGLLTIDDKGVPSNADKGNRTSVAIAVDLAERLKVSTINERAAGQTLGGGFETATRLYLEETFPAFAMLRPGKWSVLNVGNTRRGSILSAYEPYRHLAKLDDAVRENPELAAVLGNAYAISPDIIVSRMPETDEFINRDSFLVDNQSAQHSAIRHANQQADILHAVVSCKWTLRSDRAQNARSEALNLVRNRKGRLPHVVVVTGEPLPSRLASLALGTGDIDCVYHIALPELTAAVLKHGNGDTVESLHQMIAGQRLKDVSDLALDLTV